ncbi:MAG TPA: recombinase family protein [Dehalococcoidia bacterium]|nr:recombinase family protein [Dehalococcoidia bacterium]
MRAIGYFRESAVHDETLAQQNKAFLEFCEREGYEVAGTFVDGASSNGHAPGFRQLLSYLRERDKSGFVVVVVPRIESLGGDLRDAARRYFQLEGLGAQVAAMQGAEDATAGLVTAWNSQEAGSTLSDRVRAAMRRKAVKGEVLGRPPYGYKVGSRRRLELIPEEAVVVRYIYRLYLNENMGIRLIARRLNEEGLKTRRGGNWSMVSIRDILRNRVYLGTYSRFGVKVPGSHTPLASPEDFRLVQDRLSARRTSQSPRVASQFLLSGITYCGHCGNKLIGVSRKQTWKRRSGEQVSNSYRYYQCESRTNQSVCSYHTRRADELEAQVRAILGETFAAGNIFPLAGDETAVLTEREQERDRLRSRLRSIDRRLDGYVDAAAKGRLSTEKMHKLSIAAAGDRLTVEDALDAVDRRIGEHVDAAERKRRRERDVARLLDTWDELGFGELHSGLRDAISRITVTDNDAIKISLRA